MRTCVVKESEDQTRESTNGRSEREKKAGDHKHASGQFIYDTSMLFLYQELAFCRVHRRRTKERSTMDVGC